MKTNHTPRPWVVKLTGYTGRASAKYVINDVNRRAVAHIKHSTISPMEANARLIAAAPELLEALQWHVDSLDIGFLGFYDKYGFNVFDITQRTRVLIAKAKGEEND